jgi:ActR/RegA family two-component response regulator
VAEARLRGAKHLRAGDLASDAPRAAIAVTDPFADRERVGAILQRHGGNVSACARELGVHRTQLRRWLARSDSER